MKQSISIPKMTHPLSKGWDQPETSQIKFLFGHAWMDTKCFEELKNYSHSIPSGVYQGKMWKAKKSEGGWVLCWFSDLTDNECKINTIPIVVEIED